jgi:ER protein Pkr1
MATFFENLWNSIFTPGPTPTLLIATNAAFCALQGVLGLLFIFTYSIHFAVLSVISAGLWWSINWFAEELRKAEKAEAEAGRLRKRRSGLADESSKLKSSHEDDDEDEDDEDELGDGDDETETETEGEVRRASGREVTPSVRIRGGPNKILGVMKSAQEAREDSEPEVLIRGGPSKYQALLGDDALDHSSPQARAGALSSSQGSRKSLGEETGSVSTDSEWEKVSDR